jgi:hypothetical protein
MASIPVTFIGVMHYSGLEVGGGPMPGGPPGVQPPQPPLGIWGGPWLPPYVDASPPGPQPPWPSRPPVDPGYSPPWAQVPVRPTHPIYYPPGTQPHPEHPIYFPPPGSPPPLGIWGPPDMPPGFWGGGMGPGVKPQPHPEHPIVLPPNLPPEIPPPDGGGSPIPIDWKTAWTPQTGWIVVGIPSGAHPAPSAAAAPKK